MSDEGSAAPTQDDGLAGKVAFVAGGYGGIGDAVAIALAAKGATVVVGGRDAPVPTRSPTRCPARAAAASPSMPGTWPRSALPSPAQLTAMAASTSSSTRSARSRSSRWSTSPKTRSTGCWTSTSRQRCSWRRRSRACRSRRARRPASACAVGARATRHARPRLLLILQQQGRPRLAGETACGRTRAARHQRQRSRAHGGAHADGERLACRRRDLPQLLERIPLGRIAEVDDVSGPVLFFLSRAADFVTGQVLYVDGGITATQ